MQQTTVVLGLAEAALQEAVLHFLDHRPRLAVVRAVDEGSALSRVLLESHPDAAVVSPEVAAAAPELNGAALFVVAERETTAGLRAALRVGARGFYLWPEEREGLAVDAERSGRTAPAEGREPGRVIAVLGARGGAGSTFVSTHLAAAFAAREAEVVLADLDLVYGDAAPALGIPPGGEPGTIADLVPVAEEITAEHLERVLYRHPRGFRVLLAPPDPAAAGAVGPEVARATVRALGADAGVVVMQVSRSLDAVALAALEEADTIVLVVNLDVLAFRAAKRVMSVLAARGLDARCRLVVNRASRSEVVPQDAERVFGLRPLAVLGTDRAVPRAQNRGQVLAGRSVAARRLATLAASLVEDEA